MPASADPLPASRAADVLMVFHSHLLNPRAFLEDCMRYGARQLWHAGFPWEQVDAAIGTDFSYSVSDDAKAAWTAQTGCSWDNVDDPMAKTLRCPRLHRRGHHPLTTCGLEEHPKSDE